MGIIASNMTATKAGGMGIELSMTPSPVIIVASFNKMGTDIKSFHEPLKRSIQQVLAPSIRQNFDQGGRPDRWEPLHPHTIRQKKQNTGTILVRSGSLRRKAGQLNQWKIDGLDGIATMSLDGDIWYGIVHQEGSGESFEGGSIVESGGSTLNTTELTIFGSGRGYVPQRMWALIQDEDVDEIERIFDQWLQERIEASLWR